MFFRGTGTKISTAERASYHADIDVYFQPKAWVDRTASNDWLKGTLKQMVKEDEAAGDSGGEYLLLCDNLDSQIQLEWKVKRICREDCRTLSWNTPPNAIDDTQPVDAALGRELKLYMSMEIRSRS